KGRWGWTHPLPPAPGTAGSSPRSPTAVTGRAATSCSTAAPRAGSCAIPPGTNGRDNVADLVTLGANRDVRPAPRPLRGRHRRPAARPRPGRALHGHALREHGGVAAPPAPAGGAAHAPVRAQHPAGG